VCSLSQNRHFVALSQNRQFVALSQKPPKLLCYIKTRQAVALYQKPPIGCVISKTAKNIFVDVVRPNFYGYGGKNNKECRLISL
jgi:hypothetical protein